MLQTLPVNTVLTAQFLADTMCGFCGFDTPTLRSPLWICLPSISPVCLGHFSPYWFAYFCYFGDEAYWGCCTLSCYGTGPSVTVATMKPLQGQTPQDLKPFTNFSTVIVLL